MKAGGTCGSVSHTERPDVALVWVTGKAGVAREATRLRLGAELRKLRERAGLTSTQASRLVGVQQNQISNMEAGRAGVSPERVRTLACHYDCGEKGLVDALCGMATERTRGWWEEYRELLPAALLDLAEVEHHAERLRAAVALHIPGLLQTAEYSRAVFRQDVPEMAPPDVEHRVSFRIKRHHRPPQVDRLRARRPRRRVRPLRGLTHAPPAPRLASTRPPRRKLTT